MAWMQEWEDRTGSSSAVAGRRDKGTRLGNLGNAWVAMGETARAHGQWQRVLDIF